MAEGNFFHDLMARNGLNVIFLLDR